MKEKIKAKAAPVEQVPVPEVTKVIEPFWFDFYRINYNAFNS